MSIFFHSFLRLQNAAIPIQMCIVMRPCHATAARWHCLKMFLERLQRKKTAMPSPSYASFLPQTDIHSLTRCLWPDETPSRHAASAEDPGEPRRSRPAGTHRGPAGQHLLQTRQGEDRRCGKWAVLRKAVSLDARLRASVVLGCDEVNTDTQFSALVLVQNPRRD